jgi:hypothetical protein
MVNVGNPLGYSEPQAAAVYLAARRIGAVKALEDQGDFFLLYPNSVVLDSNYCVCLLMA